MIRKNIYLTEKQDKFVKTYLEKEGGGTETDVVRKALDEFIQYRESKFGYLMGRLGSINLRDIYIEISPRGAGKTYRLIKHATQYLECDSKNKVNIVAPDRGAKHIKQLIGEYFKNRIFINENIKSDNELNIKCYYDDFDYNENLKEVDNLGYYCSSPAKIRNFWNLDQNDFLIKLLNANEGKYYGCFIAGDKTLFNIDIFKDLSENEKQSEGFQKEYLCKWIKG